MQHLTLHHSIFFLNTTEQIHFLFLFVLNFLVDFLCLFFQTFELIGELACFYSSNIEDIRILKMHLFRFGAKTRSCYCN